jgi:hypothetical protein
MLLQQLKHPDALSRRGAQVAPAGHVHHEPCAPICLRTDRRIPASEPDTLRSPELPSGFLLSSLTYRVSAPHVPTSKLAGDQGEQ